MAGVDWSRKALAGIDAIVSYIDAFDREAAQRAGRRLLAAGNSLNDFRIRGRPAANGTRELVTIRPCVIRYELRDDTVPILGIRHMAQLPPPA